MWEHDFFCYSCTKRKKISLRVEVKGAKARCTACVKSVEEKEALGIPVGPYVKQIIPSED